MHLNGVMLLLWQVRSFLSSEQTESLRESVGVFTMAANCYVPFIVILNASQLWCAWGALTSPPAWCSGCVSVVVISCEQGNGSANYRRIQPAREKAVRCHACIYASHMQLCYAMQGNLVREFIFIVQNRKPTKTKHKCDQSDMEKLPVH